MKRFFGDTFMDKDALKLEGIDYPIKLEYYKVEEEKNLFGIEVVKTEYREEKEQVEKEIIKEMTNNEKVANHILECLKQFQVTPVSVKEVVHDLMEENNRIK